MKNSDYNDIDLNPPRRGPGILSIVLILLLLGTLGGGAYLGHQYNQVCERNQELLGDIETLRQEKANLTEEKDALIADHRTEVARINNEWQAKMEDMRADHEDRVQRSYEVIAQIVNDTGSAMGFVQDLEQKVKSGQELETAEIEELKAVANGLAYLHEQYRKPIHEFKELDAYLAKQLKAEAMLPDDRGKLFKKLFNKDYREQVREQKQDYYKDVGRREAVEDAREQVAEAYSRAQAEMGRIKLNADKYLADLNSIIVNKQASQEELESFFDTSSEIMKIHQRVMNVEIRESAENGDSVKP